jgi:hypothetical protein
MSVALIEEPLENVGVSLIACSHLAIAVGSTSSEPHCADQEARAVGSTRRSNACPGARRRDFRALSASVRTASSTLLGDMLRGARAPTERSQGAVPLISRVNPPDVPPATRVALLQADERANALSTRATPGRARRGPCLSKDVQSYFPDEVRCPARAWPRRWRPMQRADNVMTSIGLSEVRAVARTSGLRSVGAAAAFDFGARRPRENRVASSGRTGHLGRAKLARTSLIGRPAQPSDTRRGIASASRCNAARADGSTRFGARGRASVCRGREARTVERITLASRTTLGLAAGTNATSVGCAELPHVRTSMTARAAVVPVVLCIPATRASVSTNRACGTACSRAATCSRRASDAGSRAARSRNRATRSAGCCATPSSGRNSRGRATCGGSCETARSSTLRSAATRHPVASNTETILADQSRIAGAVREASAAAIAQRAARGVPATRLATAVTGRARSNDDCAAGSYAKENRTGIAKHRPHLSRRAFHAPQHGASSRSMIERRNEVRG